MNKNFFGKNHNKKKTKGKKTMQGNTVAIYSVSWENLVILNQLNIKNNKIDKDNFEKIHNKKKSCRNNVAIHSVLEKKLHS
jgi:hypothetical protein